MTRSAVAVLAKTSPERARGFGKVPVRIRTAADPVASTADDTIPSRGPLVDAFGRVHTDLRVSVTDRCNLRCTYCMPEEGMSFLSKGDLLSFDEIAQVARVAFGLGVGTVRLSGGEPLLRRGIPILVGMLREVGFEEVTLTTNGTLLGRQAASLAAAGLTRVNVSCDSLSPERFAAIRRGGELATVLASMDQAEAAGIGPLKVNVVVMAGVNDDELEAFAAFGRETGRTVRFIEFMPLDAERRWDRSAVVPSDEILRRIDALFPLEKIGEDGSPAERYRYRDGKGEVGVIASVTKPFCGSCDRLRLTAEGNLRNCLFAREEVPLRPILRGEQRGRTEELIKKALRASVWGKQRGHGIGEPGFVRPVRSMSMIGG
jgi:cyclic pyranopterin phosphate synthase